MSDQPDEPIDEVGSQLTRIMDQALRDRGLHPEQKAAAEAAAGKTTTEASTTTDTEAKPANDPISEISAKDAVMMEGAMRPLKGEEFQVNQLSDFGKSLPAYDEWNGELEGEVRTYMANAEFNEGQASGVMSAFREAMAQDFSQEFSDANYDKSVSFLRHQYGDEGWSNALDACNRVVSEIGGDKLRSLLRETGLGTSPAVVYEFSRIAERKGYIKRKGEP